MIPLGQWAGRTQQVRPARLKGELRNPYWVTTASLIVQLTGL
jgi:hypothetical protein